MIYRDVHGHFEAALALGPRIGEGLYFARLGCAARSGRRDLFGRPHQRSNGNGLGRHREGLSLLLRFCRYLLATSPPTCGDGTGSERFLR